MLFLGGEVDGQEIEIPDNVTQYLIAVNSQLTETFDKQVYTNKQIAFEGKLYTVMARGSDEDILNSFLSWYHDGDRRS